MEGKMAAGAFGRARIYGCSTPVSQFLRSDPRVKQNELHKIKFPIRNTTAPPADGHKYNYAFYFVL